MTLLAFDTATALCSVAVYHDGIYTELQDDSTNGHAERLMPMVKQVLEQAGIERTAIDGLVVSLGPGSFTGIRIGIATALGLASALGIPCYGVSSLRARSYLEAVTVCPLIDARRDRVYGACYGAHPVDEMNAPFEEFLKLIPQGAVITGEQTEVFAHRAGRAWQENTRYARGLIEAYMQGHFTDEITPRYLREAQAEAERRGEVCL